MATWANKKNKFFNKKVLAILLGSAILGSAVGAGIGTIAWYSYQKSADVAFTGTSINNSDLIELGFRTTRRLNDETLDKREEFGDLTFEGFYDAVISAGQLEIETVTVNGETNYVYWMHGTHLQDFVKNFEIATNTAVDKLPAITTGYYYSGMQNEDWGGFKSCPTAHNPNYSGLAGKNSYTYLPLAFRVLSGTDMSSYVENEDIYLSSFDTTDLVASSTIPNLSEGVRCKVDYPTVTDHSEDFVFDPHMSDDYNLKVGGALNLDRDIYYDYMDGKEVAYGEFDGELIYSDATTENPTMTFDECTTFDANHSKQAKILDDSNAKTCETKGNSIINPAMNGSPIVTTSNDGIGYLDLSIYLEGWDHHVLDQTLNHTFSLSIGFSIK